MPVYVYERESSKTTFEIQQKASDPPLERCPETGEKVKRVIQPAGVSFKGSGFHVNDYGK